ncbi:MAG TPA: pantoate--beta-alanine ligase [Verrucomicrobiae bacterium]|nr:pantoate--beta-alanine ligase [Verrucomicrobiae bacterium]
MIVAGILTHKGRIDNNIDTSASVHHFSLMRIVTSAAVMQRLAKQWRSQKARVGLVPTMGFLHEGHLSLIKRARQRIGPRGQVVVSIYVNPTQFAPGEDLSRYPRDFARDKKLCHGAGANVIFAPDDRQMYPPNGTGAYSTYVVEESLSRGMEGASRPTHFRGVTTVVAKLFNIVQPELAVFGAKDFQQAAVIRRMARDLNFPLKIDVAPTRREPDGLALSSRNKYLTGNLRAQATVLWRAIQKSKAAARKSKAIPATRLKMELKKLVEREPDARLDYVEFFEPDTLTPVSKVTRGTQMALAVFIGKTRLIDNARLTD